MKKPILITSLVIVVAIGIYFSTRNKAKPPVKTITLSDAPKIDLDLDLPEKSAEPKPTAPNTDKTYSYQLYTIKKRVDMTSLDKTFSLKTFESLGLKIKTSAEEVDEKDVAKLPKWNADIGGSDTILIGEILSAGIDIFPIFEVYTSGEAKMRCQYKVSVVVPDKSPIAGGGDLAGKKVATNRIVKNGGPLVTQLLIDSNIKVKELHLNGSGDSMIKALLAGRVDAVIDVSRNYGNSVDFIFLGSYTNNQFTKYPGVKIAYTNSYNVPCNLIYLNGKLSEEERFKIINTFRKVNLLEAPMPENIFNSLIGFSGIIDLPTTQAEKIVKMFKTFGSKETNPRKTFAEEIVLVNEF